jgi:hypothetical protein
MKYEASLNGIEVTLRAFAIGATEGYGTSNCSKVPKYSLYLRMQVLASKALFPKFSLKKGPVNPFILSDGDHGSDPNPTGCYATPNLTNLR